MKQSNLNQYRMYNGETEQCLTVEAGQHSLLMLYLQSVTFNAVRNDLVSKQHT